MPQTHQVSIIGPTVHADGVSGHLFRDVLDVLVEGAERALRFQIDGRSTAPGIPPAWLRSGSDFELTSPKAAGGRYTASIAARPLVETMTDRFQQQRGERDLDPRKSAVDLFEDALEDALRGEEDSERYDAGLIEVFERFRSVLRQGVERVEIVNGRTLRVDSPAIERVRALASKTYPTQRVRVAGRLETIGYSDCRFVLVLDENVILKGTAEGPGHLTLQEFFGQVVTVTGIAEFRPSGKPLRIEAERIQKASEQDAKIWSAMPKPLLPAMPARFLREEQQSKGGFAAVFGKWPGDESDEVLRVALERMS